MIYTIKQEKKRRKMFFFFLVYTNRSMTWRVVLGDHDINNHEGREQYMSVSQVYVHPYWNSNNVAGGSVRTQHYSILNT